MRRLALVSLSVIASTLFAGEPVVWRAGGSGHYPEATPPQDWSAEKNVAWKTPIKEWSNASVVAVGDKLFVCAEPLTLICLNAADGKEVWRKTHDVGDYLPPEEAKEALAKRGAAQALQNEVKKKEDAIRAIRREMRNAKDDPGLKQKLTEAEAAAAEARKAYEPSAALSLPKVHDVCGYTSCTPVSDGTNVYALFGNGVVASYALDGTRNWIRLVERPKDGWGISTSPLIADGKLIVWLEAFHALDPQTGKTLWRTPCRASYGTPALTKVGGETVLVTPRGGFLRVADGKLFCDELAGLDYNQPVIDGGIACFVAPEKADAKAYRIPEKLAEPFKPELAWAARLKPERYYASPVIHEGLLYAVSQKGTLSVVEAATGKPVYEKALEFGDGTSYPSIIRAGALLIASHDNGQARVFKPGREYVEVGRAALPAYRATPLPVGKRLYIRTLTGVVCLEAK